MTLLFTIFYLFMCFVTYNVLKTLFSLSNSRYFNKELDNLDEEEKAICVTGSFLWPVSVVVGLGYLVVKIIIAINNSFFEKYRLKIQNIIKTAQEKEQDKEESN